jgi:hypothetical protein
MAFGLPRKLQGKEIEIRLVSFSLTEAARTLQPLS